MNLICSGTERSVCAGGEGPSRGGCQEADEEDRLYGAQGEFKQRQHDAMCVVSKLILAAGRDKNWRGWRGTKKAMEPRPDGGKGGARDGNSFEVEQAPGLLMDLDVGDKAKALIKYECQASGLGNGGDGGTIYRYRKTFQGNQEL